MQNNFNKMKNLFLTLAFVLIGSFAFANNSSETKKNDQKLKSKETSTLLQCSTTVNGDTVTIQCGPCTKNECHAKLKKAVEALQ